MGVLWHKVRYDLFRHKGRTLLAVFSIAVGVFAIGAIFGMVDQMLKGMDQAHQAVFPSYVNLILRIPIDQETIDSLKEIPGVEDIDPVNQLSVRYKKEPEDAWEIGTLMMRPDYESQVYDQIALKEGDWPSEGEIAVERLTSQEWGFDIGSEVIFDVSGEEEAFLISGLIRHPFVQPPAFGGQAHFFTDSAGMADFGIPEGRFMQLLVRLMIIAWRNLKKSQQRSVRNWQKKDMGLLSHFTKILKSIGDARLLREFMSSCGRWLLCRC